MNEPTPAVGEPGPSVVFDKDRADLGFRRWRDHWEKASMDGDIAKAGKVPELSPEASMVLTAIFSASPFLTECVLAEPEFAAGIFKDGPDQVFHRVITTLRDDRKRELDRSRLMKNLRTAKRRAALSIAVGDMSGLWSLDRVTGALSATAKAALDAAIDFLLRDMAKRDLLTLEDPDDPTVGSGYAVLAMGKLGANELNYSSDIDLIVLYDPEKPRTRDVDKLRRAFVQTTKTLVKIMQERTRDGYVFRTDLRLRPDPNVTPVAVSVRAAETYYESIGRTWERAAMIKARPIAGDIRTGEDFLTHIRPFIWRRFLDFAVVEDIHAIKKRIDAHRGHGEIAFLGHDIKVGRGGIREIEFFAQTQQLIWGGRNRTLRTNRTLDTLRKLAAEGMIEAEVESDMRESYRFLRIVEHRLQMINDEQTQKLPDNKDGFKRLAAMAGYRSVERFTVDLAHRLKAVERHYTRLFKDPRAPADIEAADPSAIMNEFGDNPTEEDIGILTDLGFGDGAMVARALIAWTTGRFRATRSERSRRLIKDVIPNLLKAFGETANPDQAFVKFNDFLKGLPAGVQLFSLFRSNPALLALVAEIMGSAPRLAETLSRRPHLLDSVLDADFFESVPARSDMLADLNKTLDMARSYEETLDYIRRWHHDRLFQIGVLILRQRVPAAISAGALTDLADCCLAALLPRVEEEFAIKHGHVPGARFAIVGMGKLGSMEMCPASDLDIVAVYDLPTERATSDGEIPLGGDLYFARLTQRIVNAIGAPTAEGRLYDVDMRLRPSGKAGPVASKLAALVRYYDLEAWDWEFMALTRARAITGDESLLAVLADTFEAALRYPRDPDRLLINVAAMRKRVAAEHKTEIPWRIKHARGGIVDIEFLIQYLQLLHAHRKPGVLALGTRKALSALYEEGAIAEKDHRELLAAHRLWQGLQSLLRLTVENHPKPTTGAAFPTGLEVVLSRLCSGVDFPTLEITIKEHLERVRAIFRRLIDTPADALNPSGREIDLKISSLTNRPEQ